MPRTPIRVTAPLAACLMAAGCLLLYATIRAATLGFTCDESAVFLDYIHTDRFALFDCYDANNHFLQTLLSSACDKLFGATPFSLRIPSLAALAAYLTFWLLLLARRTTGIPMAAWFITILCNPFALDFFSLARGYAPALACLTAALWFNDRAQQATDQTRHPLFINALSAAALACLANLSFLHAYLALLAAHVLSPLLPHPTRHRPPSLRSITATVLAQVAPIRKHLLLHALLILPPTINLRNQGALYFGGTTGFWNDSVGSLVRTALYSDNPPAPLVLAMLIAVASVPLAALPAALWHTRQPDPHAHLTRLTHALLMLLLCVLSTLTAHTLSGTPLLLERAALCLLPLFWLTAVSLWTFLAAQTQCACRATRAIPVCLATLALLNLANAANITHTLSWRYDADTGNMLRDLAHLTNHSTTQPVRLGIPWNLEPTVNYYRTLRQLDWLEPATRNGITGHHDYYFVGPDDFRHIRLKKTTPLRHYPVSGNQLARSDQRPAPTSAPAN